MSDEFRVAAKDFVPLRLEIERDDLGVRRFKGQVYPTLRVLDEKGAVLTAPRERTVVSMEEAIAVGKKVEANFNAALAKADLSKPAVRSDFIQKHLARADADSALELYAGFERSDASDARFEALTKIVELLIDVGRADPAAKLLDEAESQEVGGTRPAEIAKLQGEVYGVKLKLAYLARNKPLCLSIVDDVAQRYPESDMGQRSRELKQWVEANIADLSSTPNWGRGRRGRGQRGGNDPNPGR